MAPSRKKPAAVSSARLQIDNLVMCISSSRTSNLTKLTSTADNSHHEHHRSGARIRTLRIAIVAIVTLEHAAAAADTQPFIALYRCRRAPRSGDAGRASGAGFFEQAAEVGLDRGVRDPERLGDLGSAADLDQDGRLGRRQPVGPGDGLASRFVVWVRNKDRAAGRLAAARAADCDRWIDMDGAKQFGRGGGPLQRRWLDADRTRPFGRAWVWERR
jgi:hypothetical protein